MGRPSKYSPEFRGPAVELVRRRHALLALLEAGEPLRTQQVMVLMRTPEQTTRRALDDLAALRVIDADVTNINYAHTSTWSVTPQTGRHWDRLTLPPPVCEEAVLPPPPTPALFDTPAPKGGPA